MSGELLAVTLDSHLVVVDVAELYFQANRYELFSGIINVRFTFMIIKAFLKNRKRRIWQPYPRDRVIGWGKQIGFSLKVKAGFYTFINHTAFATGCFVND
ncbi:hypothetical protein IC229_32755 [Spirosoma sp. BT702]|uniref:Uncharacterized protein n=1 Tax=Spirosoma profusum TaxID=2771354 RepID=A0A927GAA6_9BACT|nr:hypothetical protein [Spirosoma profusum]MBD2705427.1 hypothetical protein [Spirosoma profusum]